MYQALKWYRELSRETKFKAGVVILAISLIASVALGNPMPLFADLALGVGIGVASYLVNPIFTGKPLTADGLADAAVDAFLITTIFIFVNTAFNAIKVLARTNRIRHAMEANVEAYRQSVKETMSVDAFEKLNFMTGAYDAISQNCTFAYNSELNLTESMLNPQLQGVGLRTCCSEVQAINKALNAGSQIGDLYIYTISAQSGKTAYACLVCTRSFEGVVADIMTGTYFARRVI